MAAQGHKYDIIIIGSGMGGLVCGELLAREGFKVCILEKNRQIGGSLQVYARDKVIFDSGVHYLGGLDKGQNLFQLFKYLGLMDKLQFRRMGEVFDKIVVGDDKTEYGLAQGYENFISRLVQHFPAEEKAIRMYCDKIREVCACFPLYQLRTGGAEEKTQVLELSAREFIMSLTSNSRLQSVLAGNNFLYAGRGNKTPFYVHALITNHYIESSWKCIGGGGQLAKLMAKDIRMLGGQVVKRQEVVKLVETGGRIGWAETKDGQKWYADNFISNLHPAQTLAITESTRIKPAYRNRVNRLENAVSAFLVNIVFKKNSFKYFDNNYYYHREGQVWNLADHTEENWPLGFCIFIPVSREENGYAESMTLLAYMRFDEVEAWKDSFNTTSSVSERGAAYEAFKKRKAEKLIDEAEKKMPGIRASMNSYYTGTPLTIRDYLGGWDGSLYGIMRDYHHPMQTTFSPKTSLPNLFLTGQNLNLHGILGTSMSAIQTSAVVMGNDEIIEKIRNA